MTMTSKAVANPNLEIFISELIDLVKQGWEIDPSNPPAQWGYMYECTMLRDEDIVDPPAPMTRAEILAKARAARANKNAQKQETPVEQEEEKTPEETAPPPPPAAAPEVSNKQDSTAEPKAEPTSEE